MTWEIVAGLEVHVELSTQTKIFCACPARFGAEPNRHVCPVCAGLPGALPTLNRQVVEYAIRVGLALGCDIARVNRFDRKNYFYPDLPKAYQISQLYAPICRGGGLTIPTAAGDKRIGIHEIHMEEDAGKLEHDPWEDRSLVDFNRCGVPLLEIVSEPDFRSADEVVAYLERLRDVLMFLGVTDGKMQEGSMRADVNLSVRPAGSDALGTRTEMKNMSSFKAIRRAVERESRRQIELLESGKRVVQETRRWDENKDASFPMRSKENAQDYRYFPEPDLPPVVIGEDWIERVRAALPELPDDKRARYRSAYGLSEYDAAQLTSHRAWAALFESTAALCGKPKEAANWIMGEMMRLAGESGTDPDALRVDARKVADVIGLVDAGRINRAVGKAVVERVFYDDVDPLAYVREHGLLIVSDPGLVRDAVRRAMEENAATVAEYRAGKEKVFGFLVGQAMKALGGKSDPKAVNEAMRAALAEE